jgi:hypothetical protein
MPVSLPYLSQNFPPELVVPRPCETTILHPLVNAE